MQFQPPNIRWFATDARTDPCHRGCPLSLDCNDHPRLRRLSV